MGSAMLWKLAAGIRRRLPVGNTADQLDSHHTLTAGHLLTTLDIRTHRVAVASGMVSVQASCSCDQALVLMSDYAEVMKQTLDEVALDVVERRIEFGEGS